MGYLIKHQRIPVLHCWMLAEIGRRKHLFPGSSLVKITS